MEVYIKAVAKELQNIKKKIPLEYRSKLVREHFRPGSPHNNIYGLMYYSCFSVQASQVIKKCATKFKTFSGIKTLPYYKCSKNISPTRKIYTALEYYIIEHNNGNYNPNKLLKFLKDEVDTITLKFDKHKVILNKDTYEIQKI